LPVIIGIAKDIGYRNIELTTNGIKIGKDPVFLNGLKNQGLTAVYLQFDGLKREHRRTQKKNRQLLPAAICSVRLAPERPKILKHSHIHLFTMLTIGYNFLELIDHGWITSCCQ
jgi:uncharacterized radical SAM superfamily Fe-S cluster-containing enzyme